MDVRYRDPTPNPWILIIGVLIILAVVGLILFFIFRAKSGDDNGDDNGGDNGDDNGGDNGDDDQPPVDEPPDDQPDDDNGGDGQPPIDEPDNGQPPIDEPDNGQPPPPPPDNGGGTDNGDQPPPPTVCGTITVPSLDTRAQYRIGNMDEGYLRFGSRQNTVTLSPNPQSVNFYPVNQAFALGQSILGNYYLIGLNPGDRTCLGVRQREATNNLFVSDTIEASGRALSDLDLDCYLWHYDPECGLIYQRYNDRVYLLRGQGVGPVTTQVLDQLPEQVTAESGLSWFFEPV